MFERYPNFPYIMAHTGGAAILMFERLDNGYRLFPDCRKYISKLPSEFGKRLYYDSCAFGAAALMLAIGSVGVGQILFGSDDPFIGADTKHVTRLPIAERDQAAILGRNATRMLGIKNG